MLVVDDEKSICVVLRSIFRREYEVIARNNAMEALLWLKQGNTPDIILTDIKMPYFTGIEFVKGLKKSGAFRDIPIILLSGSIEDKDQKKGVDAGAYACIKKPFDPEVLKETIEKSMISAQRA